MTAEVWVLYSGYGNIGDEAILQGTLSVLRSTRRVDRVKIVDAYPEAPRKLERLGFEYLSLDKLLGPRTLRSLRYGLAALRLTFPHAHRNGRLRGLLWHRGGSGYDGYHGFRLLAESSVCSLAVTLLFQRSVLGGLSMGFTRNQLERAVLKRFLSAWDWVLLREPISLRYAKDLAPEGNRLLLVHDFAIHVSREETRCSKAVKELVDELSGGDSLVGIALRDYYYQGYYPGWYRTVYFRFIRNLVKTLAERGSKAVILPLGYLGSRENDIRFYWELRRARVIDDSVPILSEVVSLTAGEFVDVLSIFDYVISVRTHGFILATLAGVPALHLYYEHKGKGIVEHTFGLGGYSLKSCLLDENAAQRIVKHYVEGGEPDGSVVSRIQRARELNEKIVHRILREYAEEENSF